MRGSSVGRAGPLPIQSRGKSLHATDRALRCRTNALRPTLVSLIIVPSKWDKTHTDVVILHGSTEAVTD